VRHRAVADSATTGIHLARGSSGTVIRVGGNIIDGSGWIAKRLAHLRSLLDGEVSDEDRRSIEDEIAVLSKEQGFGCDGPTPDAYRRIGLRMTGNGSLRAGRLARQHCHVDLPRFDGQGG